MTDPETFPSPTPTAWPQHWGPGEWPLPVSVLASLQPVALAVLGAMARALGEELGQPSEVQDDSSSLGSDSELSGPGPYRQADRYGFIGGSSAEAG